MRSRDTNARLSAEESSHSVPLMRGARHPKSGSHPMRSRLTSMDEAEHDLGVPWLTEQLVGIYYDELWNRWNDAAVDDTLGAAFEFRGSLGQQTTGPREWRAYRDSIRAGSADFHNDVITLVCDGQRAAARLRYTGTHTGQLLGLPATGQRFEYAGAAFFVAENERLVSAWVLGDLEALRRQLR